MKSYRKTTIRDVAAHAAVSTATVSRFVSGQHDTCSEETAKRIREAIDSLHYTPSFYTRGLRQRELHTLGACVYSPFDDPATTYPYFDQLWRGIVSAANRADYSLLHYPPAVRDTGSCDPFLDGRVDALLFEWNLPSDERPARIAVAGLPIVVFSALDNIPEGCGSVSANEEAIADLALNHLWEIGHRRIAHLAGPDTLTGKTTDTSQSVSLPSPPSVRRRNRWRQFLEERSGYDLDWLAAGDDWERGDEAAILAMAKWSSLPRERRPTAVFCANDVLAVAVMRVARAIGWRIPEDLSIVGVDNRESIVHIDTPLTTVDVGVQRVGQAGIETLLRRLKGASVKECQVSVAPRGLVVRQSTAPPLQ